MCVQRNTTPATSRECRRPCTPRVRSSGSNPLPRPPIEVPGFRELGLSLSRYRPFDSRPHNSENASGLQQTSTGITGHRIQATRVPINNEALNALPGDILLPTFAPNFFYYRLLLSHPLEQVRLAQHAQLIRNQVANIDELRTLHIPSEVQEDLETLQAHTTVLDRLHQRIFERAESNEAQDGVDNANANLNLSPPAITARTDTSSLPASRPLSRSTVYPHRPSSTGREPTSALSLSAAPTYEMLRAPASNRRQTRFVIPDVPAMSQTNREYLRRPSSTSSPRINSEHGPTHSDSTNSIPIVGQGFLSETEIHPPQHTRSSPRSHGTESIAFNPSNGSNPTSLANERAPAQSLLNTITGSENLSERPEHSQHEGNPGGILIEPSISLAHPGQSHNNDSDSLSVHNRSDSPRESRFIPGAASEGSSNQDAPDSQRLLRFPNASSGPPVDPSSLRSSRGGCVGTSSNYPARHLREGHPDNRYSHSSGYPWPSIGVQPIPIIPAFIYPGNTPPPPPPPPTPPPPPPPPSFIVPIFTPPVLHQIVPAAPPPVPIQPMMLHWPPLWPTPCTPSISIQPVASVPASTMMWESGTFPMSPLGTLVPLRVHPHLLYNPISPSLPVLQWDIVLRPEQARVLTGKSLIKRPSLHDEAVVSATVRRLGPTPEGQANGQTDKIWIESETPILAWWMQRWGPIVIEKSTITVRDVLDAIHAYLSVPLTNGDYKTSVEVQSHSDGVNFGNAMRLRNARRMRASNGCELRSVALKGRTLEDGWSARLMCTDPGEPSIYRRSDVLGMYRRFIGLRPVVFADGSWKLFLGIGPGPVPKFS